MALSVTLLFSTWSLPVHSWTACLAKNCNMCSDDVQPGITNSTILFVTPDSLLHSSQHFKYLSIPDIPP